MSTILEIERRHARPASDAALLDGPALGLAQGLVDVRFVDGTHDDVVEMRIVALADQRNHHVRLVGQIGKSFEHVLDGRPRDDAHGMGVGEHDRRLDDAPLPHLGQSRHLAAPVEDERPTDDAMGEDVVFDRPDRRDAGPHRPRARFQGIVEVEERRVPDAAPLDIRDRVVRSGLEQTEREAEVAQTGSSHEGPRGSKRGKASVSRGERER